MFSLNEFLMKTLRGMIGNYPDFQIREWASNWYAKGKLTEDNLSEIDTLIELQYMEKEVSTEETTDETTEEYVTDDYSSDYTNY